MIDTFFIFGAEKLIYVAAVLFVVLFFSLKTSSQKRMITLAVVSLPLSYVVAKICSHFFYNPRPFVGHFAPLISHDADNGFPSDHTLLMAALSSLFIPFGRKISIVFWILTLLVGSSRVYVGVHSSTDIIGSIVIAFAATSLVIHFFKRKNWL